MNKGRRYWKVCRVVDGGFYSLYGIGIRYLPSEMAYLQEFGALLCYGLRMTTVPVVGKIFAFDNYQTALRNFRYEQRVSCEEAIGFGLALLEGTGRRASAKDADRQPLFYNIGLFKSWKERGELNHYLISRSNAGDVPDGTAFMSSFTPRRVVT